METKNWKLPVNRWWHFSLHHWYAKSQRYWKTIDQPDKHIEDSDVSNRYGITRCIRKRKDLHCLYSRQRRLPQIQKCAIHTYAIAAWWVEHCQSRRRIPENPQKIQTADFLILGELLKRKLTPNETYDFLETETRIKRSMIFFTQYRAECWYDQINCDPQKDIHISNAIIDKPSITLTIAWLTIMYPCENSTDSWKAWSRNYSVILLNLHTGWVFILMCSSLQYMTSCVCGFSSSMMLRFVSNALTINFRRGGSSPLQMAMWERHIQFSEKMLNIYSMNITKKCIGNGQEWEQNS